MKFYACPMCCNKGFTSQRDLKEHLAKATTSMKCPACLKSFRNLLCLIKHLDQCDVGDDEKKSPSKDYSEFSGSGINLDLTFDNEDEDDVEGYFCTVCDVKIPEVEEHVRKFHSGQEVILQDDDDEDEEDTECSVSSDPLYSYSSDSKKASKRKRDEFTNGTDPKDKKTKVTSNIKEEEEEEEAESNEVFYCPKCDMNFDSLSEHTSNYHKNLDVLVQDISIHELFSASRQNNGAFAYFCSRCQKSIVRKKTLAKHLKLFPNNVSKDTKSTKHHNNYKKSKPYSSNSIDNSCKVKEENNDEQLDSSAVYEIEEVKPDLYDFDDLGHSIFNT